MHRSIDRSWGTQMKTTRSAFLTASLAMLATQAYTYSESTHQSLSQEAANVSTLLPSVVSDLNLPTLADTTISTARATARRATFS